MGIGASNTKESSRPFWPLPEARQRHRRPAPRDCSPNVLQLVATLITLGGPLIQGKWMDAAETMLSYGTLSMVGYYSFSSGRGLCRSTHKLTAVFRISTLSTAFRLHAHDIRQICTCPARRTLCSPKRLWAKAPRHHATHPPHPWSPVPGCFKLTGCTRPCPCIGD